MLLLFDSHQNGALFHIAEILAELRRFEYALDPMEKQIGEVLTVPSREKLQQHYKQD